MPTIRIPHSMGYYVNGEQVVTLTGRSAGEALESLLTKYPALRPQLINEHGGLRSFVHLYLDKKNLMDLQGLDTPLEDSDQLLLVPAIAGG